MVQFFQLQNIVKSDAAFSNMLIDSRSIMSNLISVKQAVQRVDAQVADNHALASDIHVNVQNVHRLLCSTTSHVLDSQESVQHVEEMVRVTREKIDRVEAQLKFLTVSVVFLC